MKRKTEVIVKWNGLGIIICFILFCSGIGSVVMHSISTTNMQTETSFAILNTIKTQWGLENCLRTDCDCGCFTEGNMNYICQNHESAIVKCYDTVNGLICAKNGEPAPLLLADAYSKQKIHEYYNLNWWMLPFLLFSVAGGGAGLLFLIFFHDLDDPKQKGEIQ